MTNSILFNSTDLVFLELEPFSKREALNWIINKTNDSIDKKIEISIRHIARIWNWHKSKLERFIKTIKAKGLIETSAKTGKTSITICNLKPLKQDKCYHETTPEIAICTKINLNNIETSDRDTDEAIIDPPKTKPAPHSQETSKYYPETAIGTKVHLNDRRSPGRDTSETLIDQFEQTPQERDSFEKKKEKPSSLDSFSSTPLSEIYSFAKNLGITCAEVEWEKAKFTDHLKSSGKKVPKDILAAFRNWLRRSLEFNKPQRGNEQRQTNQTESSLSSFELFLAAGARILAERQRRGLA